MDTVSTKKTNTIARKNTNTIATNTDLINCRSRKVRDFHILDTVLLVIISLLIINIICFYAKQKGII